MKELVVISGKGGTGKTSITATFAWLGGNNIVTADCDVDAADMHLLLKPDFAMEEDFYSGVIAEIDQETCIHCGRCMEICRFNAVNLVGERYIVEPLDCEGCGYCARICPVSAIAMPEQNIGRCYVSTTKTGGKMIHAALKIGAENSGKLVAHVKNKAKKLALETGKEMVLVDGSPGIGCPVVSSLSGADFVLFVTEATVSGLHDLKRVNQLVQKFRIPAGCIINKFDLNPAITDKIKAYLGTENITHFMDLPYEENFTRAMTMGLTIMEFHNSQLVIPFTDCWSQIQQEMNM